MQTISSFNTFFVYIYICMCQFNLNSVKDYTKKCLYMKI